MLPHPRKPRNIRRRRRGAFTLIEVLVAMLTVAIIVPVAVQGIRAALALGQSARHRATAATLAHAKLEELVATAGWQTGETSGDFSDDGFPDYQWSVGFDVWDDPAGSAAASAAASTGSSTGSTGASSAAAAAGVATIYEVDVTVTWTAHGQDQSLTIGTIVNVEGF